MSFTDAKHLDIEKVPVIDKLSLTVTVLLEKSPYINGVSSALLEMNNLLDTLPDVGPASYPIKIFLHL